VSVAPKPLPQPLSPLSSFFVVGAGRVGRFLAQALPSPDLKLLGCWNRSQAAAQETEALIGVSASFDAFPSTVKEADLIFLSVPDFALEEVTKRLVAAELLGPHQLLVHLSGALSLETLAAAQVSGSRTGSLHPLHAFAPIPGGDRGAQQPEPQTRQANALEQVRGCLAVIEGDAQAHSQLSLIAERLGMRPCFLTPGKDPRAQYHAAAVMAAGHLLSLLCGAAGVAEGAGLKAELALDGMLHLARSSLDNLETLGNFSEALTGPVSRGDEATILLHQQVLASSSRETQASYAALLELSKSLLRSRLKGSADTSSDSLT